MKIGILTFLEQQNYGGVLQAYALQHALSKTGYDVEAIRFWFSKNNYYLYGYFQKKNDSFLRRCYHLARHWLKHDLIFSDYIRRERTIDFIRKYIRTSAREYRNVGALQEQTEYQTLLVGSDQIWNPTWKHSLPFLLDKQKQPVIKLAYAASFGVPAIPQEQSSRYSQALRDFAAISCREESGCAIVEQLTGKRPEWVVDPVQLLSVEEWRQLIPAKSASNDYLFCYWLGDVQQIYEFIEKYHANKTVMLCIKNPKEKELYNGDFAHAVHNCPSHVHLNLESGPLEFLELLANASEVLSDSFHAMMFALIFEKKFRIFTASDASRTAMTDRMTSFAQRIGLLDGISEQLENKPCVTPDYATILPKLNAWKQHSYHWLNNALEQLK